MDKIMLALVPSAVLALGLIPIVGLGAWRKWRDRREGRESPLTRNMLRPPGHSLQEKIHDINWDITWLLVAVIFLPTAGFALYLAESHLLGVPDSVARISIISIVCLAYIGYGVRSLHLKLDDRRNYELGMEGEMFVGQELDQLMRFGCRVFHDVPMKYGNIDHVVVSPSGVYSVETKTYRKSSDSTTTAITVDHEKNVIILPDRELEIPLKQAETESRWLAEELTGAIGEPVEVEAMLALPGYTMGRRKGRGKVYVYTPGDPRKFFIQEKRVKYDDVKIQRIAHQLDRLCRDVKPSQREERSWKKAE